MASHENLSLGAARVFASSPVVEGAVLGHVTTLCGATKGRVHERVPAQLPGERQSAAAPAEPNQQDDLYHRLKRVSNQLNGQSNRGGNLFS